MDLQPAGNTTHFFVQYDHNVGQDALHIAQAILATCERDLVLLAAAMPYPLSNGKGDAFQNPPLDVQIVNDPTIPAGKNTGYRFGGQGWIKINIYDSAGARITDQYARFVFVAEMAEQLMGFYGWNIGDSQGEALSRVMAQELYRDVAATMNFTSTWLSSPRPRADDILGVIPNDVDPTSYGCGMIFIYFLQYQLGFSLHEICTAGGKNLFERYQILTKATDDPAVRVGNLLDKHFGSGSINILGDNPFPLLEGDDRKINLAFGKPGGRRHTLLTLGDPKVHISPLFNCPAKNYGFARVGIDASLSIIATAVGLGKASFNWKINGKPLFFMSDTDIAVDALVEAPDPKNPHQALPPAPGTFHFDYKRTPGMNGILETLVLTGLNYEGDYHLALEVSASDFAQEPPVVARADIIAHTCEVVYEPAYYADLKHCEDALTKSVGRKLHAKLTTYLDFLRNLPDPPQPGYLPEVVEAVDQIRGIISALAVKNPALASRVAVYAASKVGLPARFFHHDHDAPHLERESDHHSAE